MTQFLLSDESGLEPEQPTHKAILDAVDKQQAAAEIDEYVAQGFTYLEATSQWMEERSIPEKQFSKYVPSTIFEKAEGYHLSCRELYPLPSTWIEHRDIELMPKIQMAYLPHKGKPIPKKH